MKLALPTLFVLAFAARATRAQVAEALSDWRTGQASFYGTITSGPQRLSALACAARQKGLD